MPVCPFRHRAHATALAARPLAAGGPVVPVMQGGAVLTPSSVLMMRASCGQRRAGSLAGKLVLGTSGRKRPAQLNVAADSQRRCRWPPLNSKLGCLETAACALSSAAESALRSAVSAAFARYGMSRKTVSLRTGREGQVKPLRAVRVPQVGRDFWLRAVTREPQACAAASLAQAWSHRTSQ